MRTLRKAALALALVGLLALPARADGEAELEELYQAFGTDRSPADVIVVLDTSGSMKDKWGEVRRALGNLLDSLAPGDYFAIIGFDAATTPLVIPRQVGDEREDLQREIQRLGMPEGKATDIGLGLEAAVDELNRPGANKIQFLFFLTDGFHQPGPETRYPDLQGAAWTRLADKARRTRGDRLQRIIGLGVTTRAGQDTDIELIRRVFPQAHPMTIGARELSAYVQRLRQELRREKLKLQVEAEIQQAGLILVPPQPALLYPGQGTEMELQVKSGYAHLPVRLTALPFTARRPPLEVALQEPAATVELSPGAQGKLETVRLQVDRDGGLAALLRAFGLIPDEVGQVDLVQTVRVQARHQAALELLNLPPEWKVNLTGPLRFRVRPPVNPAWPWVALTALLLGMGHLLYRKSKVQLTGRLRVVKEGSSSTCDLTEKRGQRRRATLGSASRDQCDIFLPGATPQAPVLAIIEAVSARRVRVFTPDGQPHLLSRGGKTESLDLEDGTEFQLGGYRLIYQNPELRE